VFMGYVLVYRICVLWFGVCGLRLAFRVCGLWFVVCCLAFMVWGLGFRA